MNKEPEQIIMYMRVIISGIKHMQKYLCRIPSHFHGTILAYPDLSRPVLYLAPTYPPILYMRNSIGQAMPLTTIISIQTAM